MSDQSRDTSVWIWMERIAADSRHAARGLLRTPGFSAVCVLVIALGIGAVTALFTVVRSVLLEPLPYKDPSRLVRLYEYSPDDKFPYNVVAGGVFAEWKKQSQSFSDLTLVSGDDVEYNLSTANGSLPERIHAAQASWNLFRTLGVPPAFGPGFAEADDQLSASGTVVLSWALWKRRFAGDPAILNRTIRLDSKPYTVVGVMPAGFAYPDQSVQLWTPIYHEVPASQIQCIQCHEFNPIARLRPGVTDVQARAELSVIVRRIHDAHLDMPFVSTAANTRPLLDDMVGDSKTPLYVLLAATGCLLLIACLNVASLLVARGAARRKEIAVRTALGSSRWRLLSAHLIEALLLAAAGGALGLGAAHVAVSWFVATRQDLARVQAIHVDAAIVAFAFGLVFLCAVFAGSVSSISLRADQIGPFLQESSRSSTAGRGRVRLRKWLLSFEVGLTVVLLIGAGLLLKSYARLRSTDLGCITQHVLTMRLNLPDAKYGTSVQRASFFETLLERARAIPGVQAAALVTAVPGAGYWGDNGFAIEEHPPLPPSQNPYAIYRWCNPGYFNAMGIPLLRGRTFGENQRLDKAKEIIINESFAHQYFPGEDPLGKHLSFGGKHHEIVGVVGDTRYRIASPAKPIMYMPLLQGRESDVALAVRASGDELALALPIQQLVQQMDPELAVSDILNMQQLIGKSTLDASFDVTLLLAFAVLSLTLAAVGLFGVLTYIVAGRTQEIGIRMALGAQRGNVLRLTLLAGLLPAATGLVLGIAGGAAAAKLMGSLLYGVQPLDAGVFAAVALLLLAVACAACLLPAWRASRLDPMQALRNE